MRKPDFCIGKNKGADQLCSNCEADMPLCFRYTDSVMPPLLKILALFCSCPCWFVSDPVRNHIVGFLMMQLILMDKPTFYQSMMNIFFTISTIKKNVCGNYCMIKLNKMNYMMPWTLLLVITKSMRDSNVTKSHSNQVILHDYVPCAI